MLKSCSAIRNLVPLSSPFPTATTAFAALEDKAARPLPTFTCPYSSEASAILNLIKFLDKYLRTKLWRSVDQNPINPHQPPQYHPLTL